MYVQDQVREVERQVREAEAASCPASSTCKYDLYTRAEPRSCAIMTKQLQLTGEYDAMIEIQIQTIGGWLGQ